MWSEYFIPSSNIETLIVMTAGFDEFHSRIQDLAERETECNGLFEEVKKGNGEKSLHYLALRDSCRELRKDIFKNAISAGLTRETIKMEIEKARILLATRHQSNKTTIG